jgi:NAD+ synthase (glutamine-hydrolysing)
MQHSMQQVSIALAQLNFKVGDIDGNLELIASAIAEAKEQSSTANTSGDRPLMVVFSELALIGYPPEDLLLRPSLQHRIEAALQRISTLSSEIAIVVGYPWNEKGQLFNMAGVWQNGEHVARYAMRCLPIYQYLMSSAISHQVVKRVSSNGRVIKLV